MSQPSLKKNYILKMMYDLLSMVIPLITAPYISRVLGANGVGIYSYTHSYMTYFTMFAALGTASYGSREIARNRDDKVAYSKVFWEIEILSVITSSVCLILWFVFSLSFIEYKIYFIALFPSLIAIIFDISWLYTGLERIKYTVTVNFVVKIVGATCLFLFIKDIGDLVLYLWMGCIISVLGNVSMWFFLPKVIVCTNIDTNNILVHLRNTLVYFVPTIATSIYTVLDKTLVGLITNNNYENGYYEQATKIINLVKIFAFSSINSIMGARLSYLFSSNNLEEAKNRINTSLNYILLISYGSMFGIIAVSKQFVPLFFGEGYEPVVFLLQLMSPLIVIIAISNVIGAQYYTPVGRVKDASKYMIVGSMGNLIFNIIFIPLLSAKGAVIGSIIAEAIITYMFVKYDNGIVLWKEIFNHSYKKIIAGILMLISIWMIGDISNLCGIGYLLVTVPLGIIVYIFVLCILKDSVLSLLLGVLKSRFRR